MLERIREITEELERHGYVADRAIATAVHLARRMHRPLLVEGEAGVGKTEIAKVLARLLDTELIRLQCYEGLDVHTALYEWNYQKQLLRIRLQEVAPESVHDLEETIFGPDYLLERPLLRAITREVSPVLLIDEIDRADEEFEAFLLELLSDFQVSIPELGTIRATSRPYVILTSNSTRELSDALRRRCLYLWIDYPSFDKELRILSFRLPEIPEALRERVVSLVQRLRGEKLFKTPGVAETLDWAEALRDLGVEELDSETVLATLGCLLKDRHDFEKIGRDGLERLLAEGLARKPAADGARAAERPCPERPAAGIPGRPAAGIPGRPAAGIANRPAGASCGSGPPAGPSAWAAPFAPRGFRARPSNPSPRARPWRTSTWRTPWTRTSGCGPCSPRSGARSRSSTAASGICGDSGSGEPGARPRRNRAGRTRHGPPVRRARPRPPRSSREASGSAGRPTAPTRPWRTVRSPPWPSRSCARWIGRWSG
ncbi:MAG: AAA family ATPase [Gemmatimonadota bacterium]